MKIFNWLATMWGGALRLTTSMLFACGFIGMFLIGGLTGIAVAVVPFDWQVTDSYFVVGHFHSTLFGGTAFGLFAAIYYWFPKMTGRLMDERLGKLNFWTLSSASSSPSSRCYVARACWECPGGSTPTRPMGWNDLNFISTMGGLHDRLLGPGVR